MYVRRSVWHRLTWKQSYFNCSTFRDSIEKEQLFRLPIKLLFIRSKIRQIHSIHSRYVGIEGKRMTFFILASYHNRIVWNFKKQQQKSHKLKRCTLTRFTTTAFGFDFLFHLSNPRNKNCFSFCSLPLFPLI